MKLSRPIGVAVLSTLLNVSVFGAVSAQGAASDVTKIQFDIEPQPVGMALTAFGKQSGFAIVMESKLSRGLDAQAVVGAYTPDEALMKILASTGLHAVYLDSKTIQITSTEEDAQKSSNADANSLDAQLAQLSSSSARAAKESESRGDRAETKPVKADEAVAEVVVTGTYIKGAQPVGASVKVYDREDFELSGATSVDQFMRQLPELVSTIDPSTGSGVFRGSTQFSATNFGSGAAANIHGLGNGATLMLIDGNRVAPSGNSGDISDAALIPFAALERIEILTDGASAIYGSDAVAGVVNYILRRDFEGMNSTIRYGDSTRGGGEEINASIALGKTWGSGNALLSYDFLDRQQVGLGQRPYVGFGATVGLDPSDTLLPERNQHSVFLTANRKLPGELSSAATAYFVERSGTTTQTTTPTAPRTLTAPAQTRSRGLSVSFGRSGLANAWGVELVGSYGRTELANNSQFTGAQNSTNLSESFSDVFSGDVRTNGQLFEIGGGEVRVAAGLHLRQERFDNVQFSSTSALPIHAYASEPLERNVKSAYGELIIPLVGNGKNDTQWMKRLELSAAARYDDYSDSGRATSPKFGVLWSTVAGLSFRGTYASSFKAPQLTQLADSPASFALTSAQSGTIPFISDQSRGNPTLTPERAHSWTAGVDFKPAAIEKLSLSATYFSIDYEDRIGTPPFTDVYGANRLDPGYAAFYNLSPTSAEVQRYYNSPGFRNLGVPPVPTSAIQAIVYRFPQNVARSEASGLDVALSYGFPLGSGDFNLSLAATKYFENSYQAAQAAAAIVAIGTTYNPADLKARGQLSWARRRFSVNLGLSFVDGYENPFEVPTGRIPGWLTADTGVRYSVPESPGLLGGLKISISSQNIFDKRPPYIARSTNALLSSFDAVNASVLGRYVSMQISKDW